MPGQQQRMRPCTPFMMVADKNVRFLTFETSKCAARCRRAVDGAVLVVILRLIAKARVVIQSQNKQAVVWGKLLLGLHRNRELLQAVVWPPSSLCPILRVDGVTGIIPNSVLRATFQPVAVT